MGRVRPSVRQVLVVDDDASIRDLLEEELRTRGYSVILAHNGSEALRRLESATPDAIVLDLMMPVMDGWSFVAQYRGGVGERPIPIIAVSAEGEPMADYEQLGVRAFFRKPFELADLTNCIADLTR